MHTQTTPATHKADALSSPSGQRNRAKGEHHVIPGPVPCPYSAFSKHMLRIMTIIILLDAGIAVNPEPGHTLKNPTEGTYIGIFNITLVYFLDFFLIYN